MFTVTSTCLFLQRRCFCHGLDNISGLPFYKNDVDVCITTVCGNLEMPEIAGQDNVAKYKLKMMYSHVWVFY